jgi:hypothetical protein
MIMTLTGIKVGHVRADGAGEFARSATFRAYCTRHNIVIEEVPAYTHTFNARAEGAIRMCKDKVRAFLRRVNMPRRFWPNHFQLWLQSIGFLGAVAACLPSAASLLCSGTW